MSEEHPKVIYIRAGAGAKENADLAGLIGRVMRESITTNSHYFVLQLAYDQEVLSTLQAWKTLKQITVKQGLSLAVGGGSDKARELANVAGFPLMGIAETAEGPSAEAARLEAQLTGFTLPEEFGGLSFEKMANEYRNYEADTTLRTTGGFIEFVRERYTKTKL